MRTLTLKEHDVTINSSGDVGVSEGVEGLRQKVETRLSLYRGEWFLDTRSGVPYTQRILGRGGSSEVQNISAGSINQILDKETLKEDEILSIIASDFTFDETTRVYTYTALVATVYGNLELTSSGEV